MISRDNVILLRTGFFLTRIKHASAQLHDSLDLVVTSSSLQFLRYSYVIRYIKVIMMQQTRIYLMRIITTPFYFMVCILMYCVVNTRLPVDNVKTFYFHNKIENNFNVLSVIFSGIFMTKKYMRRVKIIDWSVSHRYMFWDTLT